MTPEHQTVEYQLFHKPWKCQIPEHYCQSSAIIADRGMLTTGDPEMDRELMRAPRQMYLTIPQMAHYYDQGAPITTVISQEAIDVYNLITQHLQRWKWVIETQFNVRPPPVADFLLLDALAQGFHGSVMRLNAGKRPMGDAMAALLRITARTLDQRAAVPGVPQKVVPLDMIYKPIASDIARHLWKK